jgi:hypothetical protein
LIRSQGITKLVFGWAAALLIAAVGADWIHEGLDRGQWLARADPSKPLTLVVSRKEVVMQFAKRHFAEGTVLETGEAARVAIFSDQFNSLLAGDKLEIYRTAPGVSDFVFSRNYAESLPLIRLGDFVVTWHFPAGLAMLGAAIALGWALVRSAGQIPPAEFEQ